MSGFASTTDLADKKISFDELGPGIHVGDAPHLCHLKIDKIPRCYRRQTKAGRATGTDARVT